MALIRALRRPAWADQRPTWPDARPDRIDAALRKALARPSGGWFVLAASGEIGPRTAYGRVVDGREVVAWRGPGGELRARPGACPHLGAPLGGAPVHDGGLVCRWHGLRLPPTLPAHDDGVLAWVRLSPGTDAPVLGPRPPLASSVATVATVIGNCAPEDILANRLDPWHGAWLHPYSFTALEVVAATDERIECDVTFTIGTRLGVPVRAEFTSPEPRTVTMEIVDGEGAGSVVETHATPLRAGRTAVIEAVLAHSDRRGFAHVRRAAAVLRPLIGAAARRLWRDDLAYAERRYALRTRR